MKFYENIHQQIFEISKLFETLEDLNFDPLSDTYNNYSDAKNLIEAWQDDLGEDDGESVVAKVGLTKAERKKYDNSFNHMLKKVGR